MCGIFSLLNMENWEIDSIDLKLFMKGSRRGPESSRICKPYKKCTPSQISRKRVTHKFSCLYEKKASDAELWQYICAWWKWYISGLDGFISLKGGAKRIDYRILRYF